MRHAALHPLGFRGARSPRRKPGRKTAYPGPLKNTGDDACASHRKAHLPHPQTLYNERNKHPKEVPMSQPAEKHEGMPKMLKDSAFHGRTRSISRAN